MLFVFYQACGVRLGGCGQLWLLLNSDLGLRRIVQILLVAAILIWVYAAKLGAYTLLYCQSL